MTAMRMATYSKVSSSRCVLPVNDKGLGWERFLGLSLTLHSPFVMINEIGADADLTIVSEQ